MKTITTGSYVKLVAVLALAAPLAALIANGQFH
jgi:hypothetical protein